MYGIARSLISYTCASGVLFQSYTVRDRHSLRTYTLYEFERGQVAR